jgi:DNA adenine methylase
MSGLAPTRPVLRWHGGKWLLAPWIIGNLPPHRIYVEPFGGAASVLVRKARAYAEVYNDLDADVVNLFRVLRGPEAGDLVKALRLTPFARDELGGAFDSCDDPVEAARRLVVRSFMGFGSNACSNSATRAGFRANSNRSGSTPAHDWANYPDALEVLIARLSGVVIENRDAMAVMAAHDAPETLHFVDPPYLPETRTNPSRGYRHEMSEDDHDRLLEFLPTLAGAVVLCGYPSPQYDAALLHLGWRTVERAAFADGARPRTEVLWINRPAPVATDLFEVAA